MAEEPASLMLEMLRRIDKRLENVEQVVIDTRSRMHSVEVQLSRTNAEVVALRADFVRLEGRMDRFDERLMRIERRLDLIEA